MAKSISQKRKEVAGHVNMINKTLHEDGASVAVLDSLKDNLKKMSNQAQLETWFRGYSHRVGELLVHHHQNAALINDQRHSIERILGVQR